VSAVQSGIQEEVGDGGTLQERPRDRLQAVRLRGLLLLHRQEAPARETHPNGAY
jgi:hypothetical protein